MTPAWWLVPCDTPCLPPAPHTALAVPADNCCRPGTGLTCLPALLAEAIWPHTLLS